MDGQINWEGLLELAVYDPARPLLFNSLHFLLLFAVFYGGYLLLLRRVNLRIFYLLVFSCFFYYKSSGWYLGLLILATAMNFGFGHAIYRSRHRLWRFFFLWCSILCSLGILGYFKYSHFVLNTLSLTTGKSFGLQDIFLPVGISFYTFQTLSYTIDVYRKYLEPLSAHARSRMDWARAFMDFAFYVSFFPQLVAGPIVRAADFLPQIRAQVALSREAFGQAMILIMGGLFKKAVISDYIKVNFVDRVFDAPLLYSGLENLLAAYGYALQIYCDFSGYSDMAIGLALLLGFRLPENFRSPYLSGSIQEFWRRWHISLSSWLRDYLYISLGGNRRGRFRTYLNLMITMLLGGLWHGANWVYVLWGGLHGMGLALERFFSGRKPANQQEEGPSHNPLPVFALLFILQAGIQGALILRLADGSLAADLFWRYTLGNAVILGVWTLSLLPGLYVRALSRPVSIWLTFNFVTFGWILFRAGAIGSAQPPLQTTAQMLGQITAAFQPELLPQIAQAYPWVFALMGLAFLLHYLPDRLYGFLEKIYTQSPAILQSLVLALVIWIVIQAGGAEVVSFIYYQF